MIKTICDKCKQEKPTVMILCHTGHIVDNEDRTHTHSTIDLCDDCRRIFSELIYNWLYNK